MRICKYCGAVNEGNDSVCEKCGGAGQFSYKCDSCLTEFSDGNFCPRCGVKVGTKPKRCPECGTEYFSNACPNCGHVAGRNVQKIIPLNMAENAYSGQNLRAMAEEERRSNTIELILCIFFGYLGVHKFYKGKVGIGLLYLFTFGFGGLGWFIDICLLIAKCANNSVPKTQNVSRSMGNTVSNISGGNGDTGEKPNVSIGLVLGILGICMSCCYGVPGIVLGAIGIYFSTYGKGRAKGISNVGGFVCSVVAIVFGVVLFFGMVF